MSSFGPTTFVAGILVLVSANVALCGDIERAQKTVQEIPESRETKPIVGKWRTVAVTLYGSRSKGREQVVWEFRKDGQFTMRAPNNVTTKGRYALTLVKGQWHIEIEEEDDKPSVGGGGPRKGIVAVKGDKLTLCVSGSASGPRPTQMTSKNGSLNILYAMKRYVPKKKP